MWLADVHRTQISKYERGETEPQVEVLAKLSRALDISAEEFFAGVGWQREPPGWYPGRRVQPKALALLDYVSTRVGSASP